MSAKRAKQERKDEAAAVVQNDPQALYTAQLEYMRLAGAVDGANAVIQAIDQALGAAKEALGVTRAAFRAKQAEVETLLKATKEAEKNGKPAGEAEAPAAA